LENQAQRLPIPHPVPSNTNALYFSPLDDGMASPLDALLTIDPVERENGMHGVGRASELSVENRAARRHTARYGTTRNQSQAPTAFTTTQQTPPQPNELVRPVQSSNPIRITNSRGEAVTFPKPANFPGISATQIQEPPRLQSMQAAAQTPVIVSTPDLSAEELAKQVIKEGECSPRNRKEFNQRGGYVQSPPVGINAVDHFAAKGNLHDHLYQQYQFLQAQQDALRAQLAAQQPRDHTRRADDLAGDLPGVESSHTRTRFAGGPQTAPPFPSYMHYHPPRFASATLSQHELRPREGVNTSSSSSQGQRASEPAPSNSSIRSQSQSGRRFPHPLLVQQLAQQGYDMQALGLGNGYQNLRPS
jgi:hypothetical protein